MTRSLYQLIWFIVASVLSMMVVPASAQDVALMTAAQSIHELELVREALAKHLQSSPARKSLPKVREDINKLINALRGEPNKYSHQTLAILNSKERTLVLRAYAVAQRTESYLHASDGCIGSEGSAMAAVLLSSVQQLTDVSSGGGVSSNPAVIYAIETTNHRHPLFVIRQGGVLRAITLTGVNLTDPQCANPAVEVTNAQGNVLGTQPRIEAATPTRIMLRWPDLARLVPGSYVLHVTPRRNHFLFGCSLQAHGQAVGFFRVIPAPQITVSYLLSAVCQKTDEVNSKVQTKVHSSGILAPMGASLDFSSKSIHLQACVNPVTYSLLAKANYGDGIGKSVGPISQPANANITLGFPGNLSVTWNPSSQRLFSHLSQNRCMKSIR
ncbi:hypothetical protein [Acidithiobacillus ferrivorans]|nr:hypothetical protein [Acidithiobacillus ferrivorans]